MLHKTIQKRCLIKGLSHFIPLSMSHAARIVYKTYLTEILIKISCFDFLPTVLGFVFAGRVSAEILTIKSGKSSSPR